MENGRIKFLVQSKRIRTIAVLAIASFYVVSWINGRISCVQHESLYQDWISPMISLLTFFIAAIIGLVELIGEWEAKLPKRLDVECRLDNNAYYRVENAPLVSDSDIRHWGQQLGKQMNKGKNLPFDSFQISRLGPVKLKNGNYVVKYKLVILLDVSQNGGELVPLSEILPKDKVWTYDEDGKRMKGKESEQN